MRLLCTPHLYVLFLRWPYEPQAISKTHLCSLVAPFLDKLPSQKNCNTCNGVCHWGTSFIIKVFVWIGCWFETFFARVGNQGFWDVKTHVSQCCFPFSSRISHRICRSPPGSFRCSRGLVSCGSAACGRRSCCWRSPWLQLLRGSRGNLAFSDPMKIKLHVPQNLQKEWTVSHRPKIFLDLIRCSLIVLELVK